ncbi:MAG: phage tail length tape measure family protein [Rhabdaerophilum sp.]
MAIKIGSLLIRLAVEHGILQEGLARSERDVAKTTKAIQRRGQEIADFGQKMSLAVTLPILGIAAASIKAAQESADALGQVNAALASMGGAAGRTSEQLQALASSQMKKSLYDDDEILRSVTANLLTFGKVAGTEFDRAQQAALDLATRMDGDLKGATLQIGKALNDPIKGVGALSKAGIQFSKEQKAMIASLVETGDVAAAQRIILKELETQFAGSAKAARDADPGAALAQSFAQFQEDIGAKLLPLLPPLLDAITGIVDVFSQLSPEIQTGVIAFGAIAAALGPVIVGIGAMVSASAGIIAAIGGAPIVVSLLGLAFNTLAAALGAIAAPVAAVAAAVALWYYWDEIVPIVERVGAVVSTWLRDTLGIDLASAQAGLSEFVAGFTELATVIGGYAVQLGTALSELWQGGFGDGVRGAGAVLAEFGGFVLETLGENLIRIVNAAGEIFAGTFEAIGNVLQIVARVLAGDFSGAWQAAGELVVGIAETLGRTVTALFPEMVGYIKGLYTGAKLWLQEKLGEVFNWLGRKIEQVTGFFFDMYDAVVGNSYVPDMVDGIAAEFARLQAVMVVPAKKAAKDVTEANRQMAADGLALLDRLFPEMAAARRKAEELALINRLGLSEGSKASAIARLDGEFFRSRTQGLGSASVSTGLLSTGPLVDFGKQLEETQAQFGKLADAAKVQTVRIADTFGQMVERVSGQLRSLVDGFKSGNVFDIFDALLGIGTTLGGAGVFGKGVQSFLSKIPGNANGTAFHPGGLMMVGERGPEILAAPRGSRVVPNHELRAANDGAGRLHVTVGVDPRNGNVTAFVDRRVASAAPAIMDGGATVAQARLAQRGSRRIGR